MQRSKAGRQPGSPSWEFPWRWGTQLASSPLRWLLPAPFLCHRAAKYLALQLVYVKKLSPGFGTGWACPENQWSVTASILQPSSAPPKVFHLFGCVFCMAPMVYCLSGSKMGIYYLPDPCKVEKFGYSPYYAWGIKAVLCFCRLWNLCLNSKSQMAWAMSVWPGGAGAQVRAGPALCLGFLFWRGTLIFQMRIKVIVIRQAVPRVLWLWPRVTRQCKYSRDLKARAITAIRCP